jgi:hypothetical protein
LRRRLEGIGQVGGHGFAVDLGGPSARAVVAVLDRNLFGDKPFLEEHCADRDAQDGCPEGQAVERSGQRVRQVAGRPVWLVFPRPEQEHQQQRKPEQPAQQKPGRHQSLGALFGFGAGDRPARLLVDGFDTVDPAAEGNKFVARQRIQLGVAGLAWLIG